MQCIRCGNLQEVELTAHSCARGGIIAFAFSRCSYRGSCMPGRRPAEYTEKAMKSSYFSLAAVRSKSRKRREEFVQRSLQFERKSTGHGTAYSEFSNSVQVISVMHRKLIAMPAFDPGQAGGRVQKLNGASRRSVTDPGQNLRGVSPWLSMPKGHFFRCEL